MLSKNNITLSVIIPTLNEDENIGGLVQFLHENSDPKHVEIIVSDANSSDNTVAIGNAKGATVLITEKASRAHQMNVGASHAAGNILYFVHADVNPPASYFKDITEAVKKGHHLGCFRFKFDSKHPLLMLNSFFTRFKFLWCRGGDQTLFIKKDIFQKHHGFDENYIVMEDFELIKRLWKKYSFYIIPKSTLVSARKYVENSYYKVNMANLKIFRMFIKGVSPEKLKEVYYQLIKHPKDI